MRLTENSWLEPLSEDPFPNEPIPNKPINDLPRQSLLYGLQARIYGWAILIVLLSLAGLWLVVRQFRRQPAHPAVVSAG